MKIVEFELKTIERNAMCPACNVGRLVFHGPAVTDPENTYFIHTCDICGKPHVLTEKFPQVKTTRLRI